MEKTSEIKKFPTPKNIKFAAPGNPGAANLEYLPLSLQLFEFPPEIFLALPETFLDSSQHFVFLALREHQVIIGQLTIFLLELAFDLIPAAFEV
jgi:hypothetical protein